MRTEDMLPIAEKMDEVGFWAMEVWGGATFDTMHRFLGEDPFERIKTLKKYIKKTPFNMLLRGQNLVGTGTMPTTWQNSLWTRPAKRAWISSVFSTPSTTFAILKPWWRGSRPMGSTSREPSATPDGKANGGRCLQP
jgi:hypothetical protein